jgi:cysteine desulfurase
MGSIYLDHAAATPLRPEVAEAMREATLIAFANPSSQHGAGRLAKQLLEDAREKILELVGGRTTGPTRDRLIFTSGATEANRTAMLGLASEGCHVAVSPRDHPSVNSAAAELAARGHSVRSLPLEPDGTICRSALADEIEVAGAGGLMLAVTPVCGQTGLRDAATNLPERSDGRVTIHADATQAAAWDVLDFASSSWTSMTLAPHKFGGPRGIGALVVRGQVPLTPLLPGSQELGLRGGTEAVSLAVGFAHALELATQERHDVCLRVQALRNRLEAGIIETARAANREGVVVGRDASRAPHIAAIAFPGVDRQALVMAADLEGLCLSTGTACASGSSEPSPILFALRLGDATIHSTFRASLGRTTTDEDIAQAIEKLRRLITRLSSP